MKEIERKIYELLNPIAVDNHYNIVDIKVIGNKTVILQILLEKADLSMITIDDCAKFSRKSAIILDVEEIFNSRYTLEVSSPGINRPLLRAEDYERFKNNDVVIKTRIAINGIKTYNGYLLGIEDKQVKIKVNEEEVKIDIDIIEKAKLDIIKNETVNNKERGKNAKK